MTYQLGDWVRYHRNGCLYIGVIEYVKEKTSSYPYEKQFVVSNGVVGESEILEARRTSVENP